MKNRITPDNIEKLAKNEIFVFGSNEVGRHGGGAARTALDKFGAIYGQYLGLQGQSFAIPTKDRVIETLPIPDIKIYVDFFLNEARQNPDITYLVTPIGCGLAGYTAKDIAPLFVKAIHIENIHLPKSFWDILLDTVDGKIKNLLNLGSSLFIEYYPHTRKDMYKYINPFTDYREEKVVLFSVEEGIEKSLDRAIEDIKIRKHKYFSS